MNRLIAALCALTLALALCAPPALALDVPPHGGLFVVDQARLLPPAERNALGAHLRAYAEQTGNQIVVLTIPSLAGEDLAGYANRVARAWEVGRKDANTGVLILVAVAERKVRFEVGRGIEDRLPDITAKRIQMQITTPAFKAGRFGQGLFDSVAAIEQALSPPGAAAPEAQAPPRPAPDAPPSMFTVGLIVVAFFLVLALVARGARRSRGDGSPFFWGFLIGILSSIFRGRGGGGFGGGGFGGGGGGDGGFSGGGGDFGGGGSSSDW